MTINQLKLFSDSRKQESSADAKENVQERCTFEGPLRTKSKLTDPSNLDTTTFSSCFFTFPAQIQHTIRSKQFSLSRTHVRGLNPHCDL